MLSSSCTACTVSISLDLNVHNELHNCMSFKIVPPWLIIEIAVPLIEKEIPRSPTDLWNSYQCENWSIFIIDTILQFEKFTSPALLSLILKIQPYSKDFLVRMLLVNHVPSVSHCKEMCPLCALSSMV